MNEQQEIIIRFPDELRTDIQFIMAVQNVMLYFIHNGLTQEQANKALEYIVSYSTK